jgi:hypothetical protein
MGLVLDKSVRHFASLSVFKRLILDFITEELLYIFHSVHQES